jgi:hypothetical protein
MDGEGFSETLGTSYQTTTRHIIKKYEVHNNGMEKVLGKLTVAQQLKNYPFFFFFFFLESEEFDRLCGLVVRVLDYRSRGPGFDSLHYKK